MKTYSITFLPDEKTIEAAAGKTILEAAAAAGIAVNSVCSGDGVCGRCRVIVKSGKVTAKPNMFLDRREIQRGMALACQTFIDGDVVIEVPHESRLGGVPQLATEDAIRFGSISDWVGEGALFPRNPLFQKVYIELPKPTIDDSICDQERVFRELRKTRDIPIMQTGLAVLNRLPDILRQSGWKVTVLLGCRGGTVEVVDVEPGDTSAINIGVALDLGTTTVVAHLVDLNTSRTLATKAKYNSQISFGDDVIARIMFSATPERRTQLRDVVVNDINDLITALVVDAKIRLNDVSMVACAGNTTMIHLLCGLNPANIRKDPYVPAACCPPTIRAAEVGIKINSRGLLSVLPSVASYVGGDVVADVLVSGMMRSSELSLLIDLGTNGELVVGNSDWMVCCSASAGPSFEGGGITCGMRATNGAIEHIQLGPNGSITVCNVVGGGKPLGLCGSGLIDAVAELLKTGCIDRRGRFDPAICGSRLRESETGDKEFLLYPGSQTALGRDLVLTEADINNLIHSKGSIYMATECLLDHVGMKFEDLQHVYIAGGFGNYLKIEQGVRIGLLPDLAHSKFKYIGNGSVLGAKMVLLSQEALQYVHEKIAGAMTYLELSSNHKYMNEYSSCLFLPHTDIEKFPSLMGGPDTRPVTGEGA
ncbi:MAG: ASKHA domain-containing protein [bacterium]